MRAILLIALVATGLSVPGAAFADQVKATFPGCRSKATFEKVHEIIMSGDKAARDKILMATMLAGECAIFKPGTTVFRADSTWDGLACLRPEGEISCLWTLREVISGF